MSVFGHNVSNKEDTKAENSQIEKEVTSILYDLYTHFLEKYNPQKTPWLTYIDLENCTTKLIKPFTEIIRISTKLGHRFDLGTLKPYLEKLFSHCEYLFTAPGGCHGDQMSNFQDVTWHFCRTLMAYEAVSDGNFKSLVQRGFCKEFYLQRVLQKEADKFDIDLINRDRNSAKFHVANYFNDKIRFAKLRLFRFIPGPDCDPIDLFSSTKERLTEVLKPLYENELIKYASEWLANLEALNPKDFRDLIPSWFLNRLNTSDSKLDPVRNAFWKSFLQDDPLKICLKTCEENPEYISDLPPFLLKKLKEARPDLVSLAQINPEEIKKFMQLVEQQNIAELNQIPENNLKLLVNVRKNGLTALHIAAQLGNVAMLRLFCDKGRAHPDERCKADSKINYTALAIAVENHDLAVIEELAERKASGEITVGSPATTILALAAKKPGPHTFKLVKTLIEKFNADPLARKVRINYDRNHDLAAVSCFVTNWQGDSTEGQQQLTQLMDYILEKIQPASATDLDDRDLKEIYQTLFAAVRKNNLFLVKLLLDKYKVDVNSCLPNTDKMKSESALSIACELGLENMVRELMQRKAKTQNESTQNSRTNNTFVSDNFPLEPAIVAAAQAGELDIIKILVGEFKVDIETMDCFNFTALAIAARKGHIDVVEYLLEQGAQLVPSVTPVKNEVVHSADNKTDIGDSKAVDQTPSNQANTKTSVKQPRFALIEAIEYRQPDMAIVLSSHKKEALNYQDPNNNFRTALHVAVAKQYPHLIDCFLQNGADPNIQDINGETALHYLARRPNKRFIRQVIELFKIQNFHFDLSIRNSSGKTPLEVAADSKNDELVTFFLTIKAAQPVKETQTSTSSSNSPNSQAVSGAKKLHPLPQSLSFHKVTTAAGSIVSVTVTSLPSIRADSKKGAAPG